MAKRILTNMLSEKLYQTEDFDNSDWEIKKNVIQEFDISECNYNSFTGLMFSLNHSSYM